MTEHSSDKDDLKKVIGLVAKLAANSPALNKDEENKHGGFSFVGIDTFYATVAKKAAAEGLIWKARETDASIVDVHGSRGPTSTLFVTYEFDLLHAGTGTIWQNYFRISIVHPLQGAQTAGSAMSYAEKQFMREVFKVVTGEGDADSTDSNAFVASPVHRVVAGQAQIPPLLSMGGDPSQTIPVAEKVGLTEGAELEEMMVAFLPDAKTEQEMLAFWSKNTDALMQLKESNKKSYDRLVAAFKARKTAIKSAKE